MDKTPLVTDLSFVVLSTRTYTRQIELEQVFKQCSGGLWARLLRKGVRQAFLKDSTATTTKLPQQRAAVEQIKGSVFNLCGVTTGTHVYYQTCPKMQLGFSAKHRDFFGDGQWTLQWSDVERFL